MPSRKDKFPQDVCLAAQHSQRETGVLACVTLAQWALESNFGRSIPKGSNNPFGIKARKNQEFVICNTQEWNKRTQQMEPHTCRFAKYATIEEAFKAHGELLTTSRYYKDAMPFLNMYEQYISRMGRVYATDPDYSKKLLHIINKFALYELNLPQNEDEK